MHKLAMIIATIFSISAPLQMAISHVSTAIVVAPLETHKNVKKSKVIISVASLHHLAGKWTKDVLNAARKAHISPRLVASVLHVENRGEINESAHRVSSAGAIGPMQLMPTTAWDDLRVNPWNPRQNIDGGARYLASLLRRFGGHRRLALIAYNAGPSAVAGGARPECAVLYADAVLRYAG
ncbi:MAG: lytic transglycosylase domain-containing protein [Acidithiobacillus sp.]|nr:lytic transglycosylase domain-containing protein [Acidithiobacillus sp.]